MTEIRDPRLIGMYGYEILDDGYTIFPNSLFRVFGQLDITYGELVLIQTILTYRHDERDPYPSQQTLADHLGCGKRQIKKMLDSLFHKGYVIIGERKTDNGMDTANAYNFKPLFQKCVELMKQQPGYEEVDEGIVWRQKPRNGGDEQKVHPRNDGDEQKDQGEGVQKDHPRGEQKVHPPGEQKDHPKKKREKEKVENEKYENHTPTARERMTNPQSRFEGWLKLKDMHVDDELLEVALETYDIVKQEQNINDTQFIMSWGHLFETKRKPTPDEFRTYLWESIR